MLSVFLLPTGYRVHHSTTLSVRLLSPGCCMPLRHGGGLWVRTGGHAYRRCCGDWSGCDTCLKITQVSNNYARVLTLASSVLFVQIQAMFYMTYCPPIKTVVYALRPRKH